MNCIESALYLTEFRQGANPQSWSDHGLPGSDPGECIKEPLWEPMTKKTT